jgi:hypothetical protein
MPPDIAAMATEVLKETLPKPLGDPGTDPTAFLPEPCTMKQVLRKPFPVRAAWTKAFVKELRGLVFTQQAVAIDDPWSDDEVVPVKEIFKCKLDKTGEIDKLKCRIVFRGDLYDPKDPMDSWNKLDVASYILCPVCEISNVSITNGLCDGVLTSQNA